MIKVYGSITCPDCRGVLTSLDEAGIAYEFLDICTNLLNLKEFLQIRDKSPVFDKIKAGEGIGIPCIVLGDGTVTLSPENVLIK